MVLYRSPPYLTQEPVLALPMRGRPAGRGWPIGPMTTWPASQSIDLGMLACQMPWPVTETRNAQRATRMQMPTNASENASVSSNATAQRQCQCQCHSTQSCETAPTHSTCMQNMLAFCLQSPYQPDYQSGHCSFMALSAIDSHPSRHRCHAISRFELQRRKKSAVVGPMGIASVRSDMGYALNNVRRIAW